MKRPGRADITPTRSASITASSIAWVISSTVACVSRHSRSSSSPISSRVCWSSAPNVSSSVVLPQPDGPTMVTNSPAPRSRSSGPSAWTRPLPDSKTLVTPLSRARTCAMPVAGRSMGPGLQILRQEAHVGDFLPVDRLLELADDLQAFDHAIHRGVIQRAFAPVFDVEKMPEYLAGERRVDVIGLGDDVGRLVGMRLDVFHAFAAALDDRPDLLGPGLGKLVGDDADGLGHVWRQHVLGPEHRLDLGSFLRPHRLARHAGLDGAAPNRGAIC